ncbi:MAG: hypothetical protein OQK12_07900, partial [Motiliproteus sp.]|nr:hypothetical protein [Motiliproteus sp.]
MERQAKDNAGFSRFSKWCISVAIVYLPFVLFLLLLWFHTAGGELFIDYLKQASSSYLAQVLTTAETQALLLLKLESQFIHYSGYLLVHCLLAIGVGCYFLLQFHHFLNTWQYRRPQCIAFTAIFTFLVLASLVLVVATNTPFSNLTITPFQLLAELIHLEPGFEKISEDSRSYFLYAQLLPIIAAVPAIVLASASFHLRVFGAPQQNRSPAKRLA